MRFDTSRRRFIAASTGVLFLPAAIGSTRRLKPRPRIVILGGGFGGARAARRLRELLPDAHIHLIEENERFIPGVLVIPFLFSDQPVQDIQFDYRKLVARGIEVTRAAVIGVNPAASVVESTLGSIPFDYLIVATGTRYDMSGIDGLRDHPEYNVSPFDRERIEASRQRLREFDKGNIVISISAASAMCPPAPYEYALLLAAYQRKRNPKTKIIVLDAHLEPQPSPVSKFFMRKMARFNGALEYVPAAGDPTEVDIKGKRIRTRNDEEVEFGLLSVFPAGAVAPWVQSIGSSIEGDIYVDVDPLTMQTRRHPNIYALGDVARVPFGKSAFAATVCAERCARTIARSLGKSIGVDSAEVTVACFPYVSPTEAMLMKVRYQVTRTKIGSQMRSHVESRPASAHMLTARRQWEQQTLHETFL